MGKRFIKPGENLKKSKHVLDSWVLEDLKKEIDLVAQFEKYGVKLTKKGKSYITCCPWHDDKTPSLSVDKEKGLYNCFGCGESGDILTLVQKMEGVDFNHAMAIVQQLAGYDSPLDFKPAPAKGVTHTLKEPAPPVPSSAPEIGLADVLNQYRKNLQASAEAQDYLKARGLWNPELLNRLEVGFSNGKLTEMISAGQKEELTRLGIFSEKGFESMTGCIVVPQFDESGLVVGFYGRSIDEKSKLKHRYLKGGHKGLVNRKAIGVYADRLIITESVIDALSLIVLGFENVIPCYGTNGFTSHHLQAFTDNRVTEVVIAFDNDEAGKLAATKLKDTLLEQDISVRVVELEGAKDWNEALTGGLEKEMVNDFIEAAEVIRPAPKEFEATEENGTYFITVLGLEYRVLDVKENFVSNLKVTIGVDADGLPFTDKVDLYSAKSRHSFASNLSSVIELETNRIKKDLLKILQYLEQDRDRKLSANKPRVVELTEKEKEIGLAFLKDPRLFDRIAEDLETLGYVGETLNKQLMYIAASSRKLDDPISVIVMSQSGAGKSYLIELVRKLIPPEEVVTMTSLSDQALNYIPAEGLMHKFVDLGEAVFSEAVEHQVREMLSGQTLSRLVVSKNEKNGELESKNIYKDVIVAAAMSTTNFDMNAENASRCFVINTDESSAQTQAIHRRQRQKYSLDKYRKKRDTIPEIVVRHHYAQRLLTARMIVNSFAGLLDFPSSLMRSRRDHDRFIDLISCVCFLRQYQKEILQEDRIEYIRCDLDDYRIAYDIMTSILPSTLTSFPKGALVLYEKVRTIITEKAKEQNLKPEEVVITQREIREETGLGQFFVKQNIRCLVEYEYLRKGGLGTRGSRNCYALVHDSEIALVDMSMIPTPDEIELKLQNL